MKVWRTVKTDLTLVATSTLIKTLKRTKSIFYVCFFAEEDTCAHIETTKKNCLDLSYMFLLPIKYVKSTLKHKCLLRKKKTIGIKVEKEGVRTCNPHY